MEEDEEEDEDEEEVEVEVVVVVMVVNGESCRGAQRSRWIERFHDFASLLFFVGGDGDGGVRLRGRGDC
ncbi:hypothetical protein M0804_015411 [Polistes exclamans]|nr:hypothetical protein M0804_015411 [Polistes exclamans]